MDMHQGRERQGGVGDAARDDDVGAGAQPVEQRLGAEIRVRGDDLPEVAHAPPVVELEAGLDAVEDVVAEHRGDARREPHARGQRGDRLGAGARVGGAGVGEQPHAPRGERGHEHLHAPQEHAAEAARRIGQPLLLGERDGALGEAFQHEEVDRRALDELERRLQPVAGEAGAAADPDRPRHRARMRVTGMAPPPQRNSWGILEAWQARREPASPARGACPQCRSSRACRRSP